MRCRSQDVVMFSCPSWRDWRVDFGCGARGGKLSQILQEGKTIKDPQEDDASLKARSKCARNQRAGLVDASERILWRWNGNTAVVCQSGELVLLRFLVTSRVWSYSEPCHAAPCRSIPPRPRTTARISTPPKTPRYPITPASHPLASSPTDSPPPSHHPPANYSCE